MPGADLSRDTLSTQEQAWAAAAGAVLGRDGAPGAHRAGRRAICRRRRCCRRARPARPPRATWATGRVGGRYRSPAFPRRPLPAARTRCASPGNSSLWTASPRPRPPEAEHGVRAGARGQGRGRPGHRAMLQQGLPAGWEIAGRLAAAMCRAWPGSASCPRPRRSRRRTTATPRWSHLTAEQPNFRLAVRLRAVTPGSYELPGAELADMYRPACSRGRAPAASSCSRWTDVTA